MEAPCSEGWQPLHHATYFGSSNLVEILVQGGVNPHAPTKEGKTASSLGFCTVGTPIQSEEQERIQYLLKEAMSSTKKQKNFKVALKKASTVQDKHNFFKAATFSMTVVSRPQLQKAKTTAAQVSTFDAIRSSSISSSVRPQPPHHAHTAPLLSKEFTAGATADVTSPLKQPTIQVKEEPATLLGKTKSPHEPPDTALSETSLEVKPTQSTNISQTLAVPSTETTLSTQSDPKIKRRTTLGFAKGKPALDMSKLSLAGMSRPTFDIGKQTLELGNKTLEVGKQGIEISKHGLERGNKQGIEIGKRGVDFSKQRYNKAVKFATRKGKRSTGEKEKVDGKGGIKDGGEVVKGGVACNDEGDGGDESNDDARSVFSLGEFAEMGDRGL
ncbi:MAG: hypothetical protein Q9221_007758 [Calogaya cf. arnoldii]